MLERSLRQSPAANSIFKPKKALQTTDYLQAAWSCLLKVPTRKRLVTQCQPGQSYRYFPVSILSPCDTDAGSALFLQFAGKGVKRYLADCEACLRIQVQSDTIDGTTEFLRVGKLRVFRTLHHLRLPSNTV
jgi:hypothetical protein